MKHGMNSDDARRIRLTGNQLKNLFIEKYTSKERLLDSINLVQPIDPNSPRTVLVKSGANWQFRLGRFIEIEDQVNGYHNNGKIVVFKAADRLNNIILHSDFFLKYAFHSSLFITRNGLNWQIFKSEEIIKLLLDHCSLRILKTGRVKIDFHDGDITIRGIITLEYRPEPHKKCWVFGAHGGGAGDRLRIILQDRLIYTELPV